MTNFDRRFITELFLDDTVSTINRLVVATANVVKENLECISHFNNFMIKEYDRHTKNKTPLNRRRFYESVVKKFSDDDYINNLKISKSTVKALITFLREHMKPCNAIIPLDKKVHVFLWALTRECSFKDIGEKFGLHKSSVNYIFHEIASVLSEQRYCFISWPSIEEQHTTRAKVNGKYGFPNCVGFINTCCFKIGSKRKRNDTTETILLQAVCDEGLLFVDVHVGKIGNNQIGQLFNNSPLSKELGNFIEVDNHILGDEDYKLQMNLMTPFPTDRILTSEEKKFNETHSKACNYIEQAFHVLKWRFKKLKHINLNKPESIKSCIFAACVLHNFVLLHEGCPIKEESVHNNESVTIDPKVVTSDVAKRQFLCTYINYKQTS